MRDFTGYMTINGKDAWTHYFVFLCEDKLEDNFNFGELLKPLKTKPYTTVDFRERNGEELPDVLPPSCYEARDITLYFALYATTLMEYNIRRAAFIEAIRTGWQDVKVKELPETYHFYYKDASDAKILKDAETVLGCWKVKFREPKPGFSTE